MCLDRIGAPVYGVEPDVEPGVHAGGEMAPRFPIYSNQRLSLLKLPKRETVRILAMGDHCERRLLTERALREQLPQ